MGNFIKIALTRRKKTYIIDIPSKIASFFMALQKFLIFLEASHPVLEGFKGVGLNFKSVIKFFVWKVQHRT